MIPAVGQVFPLATHAYCCQHIADNVQARYGIKCRPLFWTCARAKTKVEFQKAIQELYSEHAEAGRYIDSISHELWARYV